VADAFILRLDLDKLRARMTRSDGSPASRADVVAWLEAMEFVATDDPAVWVGEEVSVEQLRPEEIVRAKPIA
jgi:hypothetical protein